MGKITGLSNEIVKALTEYTTEVEKGLEEVKQKTAKDAVTKLKNSSPKRAGKYAKGWGISKVGNKQVIHNKTSYQLTHVLEYGHAKVSGGRVAAKPHIRPIEEQTVNSFIDEVKKVISK